MGQIRCNRLTSPTLDRQRTGRVGLICMEEFPVYQAERSVNVSYVCKDVHVISCRSAAEVEATQAEQADGLMFPKCFLVSEEL